MGETSPNPDVGTLSGQDLLAVVHAFQAGNKSAFDALYAALWRPVFLRAKKMGVSDQDAEDIAQRTLVRVYLSAPKAVFSRHERFWGWVYTIATREVLKFWGRKKPDLVNPDVLGFLVDQGVEDQGDLSAGAGTAEELRDAGNCIRALSEMERGYLLVPLSGKLTFRQAADAFRMTLGKFKHQYEKALSKVRECLRAKGHLMENDSAQGPE